MTDRGAGDREAAPATTRLTAAASLARPPRPSTGPPEGSIGWLP